MTDQDRMRRDVERIEAEYRRRLASAQTPEERARIAERGVAGQTYNLAATIALLAQGVYNFERQVALLPKLNIFGSFRL